MWDSSSRLSCASAATAPWARDWSSWLLPLASGVGLLLPAAAPDLGCGVTPLVAAPDLGCGVTPLVAAPGEELDEREEGSTVKNDSWVLSLSLWSLGPHKCTMKNKVFAQA